MSWLYILPLALCGVGILSCLICYQIARKEYKRQKARMDYASFHSAIGRIPIPRYDNCSYFIGNLDDIVDSDGVVHIGYRESILNSRFSDEPTTYHRPAHNTADDLIWDIQTERRQHQTTRNSIDPSQYAGPTSVYRTKDGSAYYIFGYLKRTYGFEIDILSQPSYRYRDDNAHVTHRLSSHSPGVSSRICIYESKAPKTIEQAQAIAMDWAELTQVYIKKGITIDDQINRRSR